MLNLTKLEQKLDKALLEETEESLTAWMFEKRNRQENIDSGEELNKYQLLHPKIFDLGYNKGIESYDNCMSREHTFNYLFKYNDYKDSELSAFINGAMSGWDDSEKEDYLTNLNEE
mgnify:CR=1 FL=1